LNKDSSLAIVTTGRRLEIALMAEVTSKYQVTVPRAIADKYKTRPGDDINWVAAGEVIRVIPPGGKSSARRSSFQAQLFDQAAERHRRRPLARKTQRPRDRGWTREDLYTPVAALVDTNVLVYRFDGRFADKKRIATEVLRRGIIEDSVRLPHQAIVEFIAAVTRAIRGHIILKQADALREAEEFLNFMALSA